MRIKITYTFEYDANPEHYEGHAESAQTMANFDYGVDPAWFLTSCGDGATLIATEVFPGYHDMGYGCKRCGCRNAMAECDGLYCVPCF